MKFSDVNSVVKSNQGPISDEEAARLKAEFAEDDQAMGEAAMADYLPMLQREDQVMKPNFEQMTDVELRTYAIAHRDEIEPLRVLFDRRSPDSEAILFHPPKTEEEWQQQLEIITPILEKDRAKEKNRQQD